MATLKDLRVRIRSVRSTQKITSAMKMVAASRLRRAQEQAEAARPYSTRMERMLSSLAANLKGSAKAPKLLAGTALAAAAVAMYFALRYVPSETRRRHDPPSDPPKWMAHIAAEQTPVAVVDLAAFDRNLEKCVAAVASGHKQVALRIATKSIRCISLIARFAAAAASCTPV